MKNMFLIIFLLLILAIVVEAEDIPGGTIDGGTWTVENSPYIITGNITIANLTIEPGVRVQFRDNYSFEINGDLQAQGFYSDSIYFQSEPGNPNGWKGIKFKGGSSNSSLKYCRIENANGQGTRIEGGVALEFHNCRISDNIGNGLFIKDSEVQLKNCIIKSNSENGISLDAGKVTATNIIIASNQLAGILTSDNKDDASLTNTVIANNQTIGLDFPKGDLTVLNSIIYLNNEGIVIDDQTVSVTYSNVQGSGTYPGTGNINVVPNFESGFAYTLSDQSLCIDAGRDDSEDEDKYFPPSKETTRNDMGAYGGPLSFGWYPPLLITPNSIQYGRTTQDSTKTVTLHIDNYRDDTGLTVEEIEFLGINPEVFTSNEEYFYLPQPQDKEVEITFKPDQVALFEADLAFRVVNHGNVFVSLNGEGVLPKINVVQSVLEFGSQAIGDSLSLSLPIQNLGGDTLLVNLSILSDSIFYANKESIKIEPDSSLDTVSVTFKPLSPSSYENYLIISSNDDTNPSIAIHLTGEGQGPLISSDTNNLNFGHVHVNSDSSLDLPIRNDGNAPLIIDSLTLSPTDGSFEIINSGLSMIEAGESTMITIRFEPSQWGEFSGNLLIHSNVLSKPLLSISLIGIGLAPELVLSNTTIDFGPVYLTKDSTIILSIFNHGNQILTIDSIFTQQNDGIFKLPDTLEDHLAPDQGLDILLTFTPADTAISTDYLIIRSNDPLNNRDSISLRGMGIRPILDPGDMALDFGTVNLPADTTLYLNVKNTGNYALVIKNFTILSETGGFSRSDTLAFPDTLMQQDHRNYPLKFKPLVWGADSGQINIETNDPLQPQTTISLHGKGLAPHVILNQKVIDYGSVLVGHDSTRTITLTNSGNVDLIIDDLLIKETTSSFIIEEPSIVGLSIKPDSSKNLTITFAPDSASIFNTVIQVFSNDPQNVQDSIMLSGVGYVPHVGSPFIHLSDTLLAFADTPLDSISNLSVTVSNHGDEVLILYNDSLKIIGDNSTAFQISKIYSSNIEINPSKYEIIPLSFNPDKIGLNSAYLKIVSNDIERSSYHVELQGNGIVEQGSDISIALDTLNSTLPFSEGEPGDLSFHISNSQSVDSAHIYFREGGALSYTKMPLLHQDLTNTWSIQINSAHITGRGLEYYVIAYHSDLPLYYPDQTKRKFNFIYVNVSNIIFPYETAKSIYQMISIPLDTKGQTLSELFSDNLGPYNNNNFRIFECLDGSGYQERTDMSSPLPPGKAIWLITRESMNLDIDQGQTVPTDRNFEISLKKGWNMIASPYAFTVDWQNVTNKLIIREYIDQDWTFAYDLEPFKGYAVHVDKDTVIGIPPQQKMLQKKINNDRSSLPPSDWTIQLVAQAGELKDKYNYVGAYQDARNSIDRFDYADPPPIGNHIRLALQPEDPETFYSTDIRQTGMDGYRFKIKINSNVSGKKVLNLIPDNLPDGFDWVLISIDENVMYRNTQIQISKNQGNFELLVGNSDFLTENSSGFNTLPLTYQLEQNYPNPFNPLTTIKFQLPKAQRVTATIYNILGQKIIELSKNELFDAGYHQYNWDGRDKYNLQVSSGIYFLRFKMANYEKTMKMILQR